MSSALGLPSGQLHLVKYDDSWPRLFAEEKTRLKLALGHWALDIQHVGSTAVPGMTAKPILDIAVAVESFEGATVCIRPIENLGYTYRGENGIPRRHYFVKGEPRTHHLHMVEISSSAWEEMLLFREWLTLKPRVAQEYTLLKARLAQKYPNDRQVYQEKKAPFIQQVIEQALSAASFISAVEPAAVKND